MKLVIITIVTFVSVVCYSQTQKMKYANSLYESFAFNEASDVFSEIVDKELKKGEEISADILLKAALSNYNSRKYNLALKYFSLMKFNDLSKDEVYTYIDCLIRTKSFNQINNSSDLIELRDNLGQNLGDLKDIQIKLDSKQMNYSLSEVGYNSEEGDYGITSVDGVLYFSSSRKGLGYTHSEYEWDGLNYSNIFSVDSINNEAVFNKESSSILHDGLMVYSPKENKVYITRTEFIKKGKGLIKHLKVYSSDYSKKDGLIGNWTGFKYNSDDYNLGHVTFSEDGDVMYLVSDMPGGYGGSDIYYSERIDGEWSRLKNYGEKVNTIKDEMFPFVKSDVLYFSSNGYFGYGGLDVFQVDINGNGIVENLGSGINGNDDDFGFYMISDELAYLSSDRKNGIDRIYSVSINEITGYLVLKPMDKLKRIKLENPSLILIDRESSDTLIVNKNEFDEYVIPIKNKKDYIISGYKKDYELESLLYLNTDNLSLNDSIVKDVNFIQTHYDLVVKTVVKGTGAICPEVSGVFVDPVTKDSVEFITDINGFASVNILNHHNYDVDARKKGYLDLNESIYTDASILIELDLKMEEIKKDMKFEVKNIFYDLNKWDLREESKVELDKLVDFLMTNDNISVELSSHTDSRASNNYNQTLSQKRAQSCVTYMISKGVDKTRIVAKGYGESQLINRCSNGVECSEEEHQANRRTEIKILDIK